MSAPRSRFNRRNRRANFPGRNFPPNFSPVIHVQHRYRFSNTSTESKGSAAIVTGHSINNLLWFATATTTAQAIYVSSRLKSVEVWGIPNASGFSQVAIEWSGLQTPNVTRVATGDNVVLPHIRMKPPPKSLAAFWINPSDSSTANQQLFALSAPTGSICDVVVEHTVLDNDNSESTYALTCSGATAGIIYYNELDNTTPALNAGAGYWTASGVASSHQAWG